MPWERPRHGHGDTVSACGLTLLHIADEAMQGQLTKRPELYLVQHGVGMGDHESPPEKSHYGS